VKALPAILLVVVPVVGFVAGWRLGVRAAWRSEEASRSKTASLRAKHGLEERLVFVHEAALERFRRDVGRYPTTVEGLRALFECPDDQDVAANWRGPYLDTTLPYEAEMLLKDMWGNDLQYLCPGDQHPAYYDLWSTGFDPDDPARWITNW
jgi:general secretion pathway protein G